MKNAPLEANAVVHRDRVWRLWRPTQLGVMKVRLLPVPRGLSAVAWCVVLLPHNWRWDERHRWQVAVLQNAAINTAFDLARVYQKDRAQELWSCLPTETCRDHDAWRALRVLCTSPFGARSQQCLVGMLQHGKDHFTQLKRPVPPKKTRRTIRNTNSTVKQLKTTRKSRCMRCKERCKASGFGTIAQQFLLVEQCKPIFFVTSGPQTLLQEASARPNAIHDTRR